MKRIKILAIAVFLIMIISSCKKDILNEDAAENAYTNNVIANSKIKQPECG
jgi:PBP1b-binding outer membrane lipoprotein LpoB